MEKLLLLELEGLRRIADYTNQDFLDYLSEDELKEYDELIEKEE